jgi:hypothetical protein
MKVTKTAKKREKPSRKKAAAGVKTEKSVRAKTDKNSGAARKEKKSDGDVVVPGNRTSAKTGEGKTGTAGVKHSSSVPPAATAARKKTPDKEVPPQNIPAKITGEKGLLKTLRKIRRAEKPTKNAPKSPAPRIKSSKITGELSFKQPPPRTGEAGIGASWKGRRPQGQASGKTLPAEYGENEFFLIPVEPRVVYASWEITKESLPGKIGGLKVRFFEVTRGEDRRPNSRSFLDISISERVGEAFFKIGIHGREIIAEIGHLGPDGHFRPLLKSRKVLIPSSLTPDEIGPAEKELLETGGYGSRPPEK